MGKYGHNNSTAVTHQVLTMKGFYLSAILDICRSFKFTFGYRV